MICEALQNAPGVYEALNGYYKKRLVLMNPDLPWYGKITGFTEGAREVIRLTKDPVEGCLQLDINRRLVGLTNVTYQIIINPDDTVNALQARPNMMAIEQGIKVPQEDTNEMLFIIQTAFHIRLPY